MKLKISPSLAFVAGSILLIGCGPRAPELLWKSVAPQSHLAAWAEHGDANADGIKDLLVGSSGGGADLYYGSAQGFAEVPAWHFRGGGPEALTGLCVGFVGDMDKDGFPEMFVAAPREKQVGAVYLFRTNEQGPEAKPWKTLPSPARGEGYAEQVRNAGDLNGDGYADLAVADFSYSGHRGRVYVYYGAPQGPPSRASWIADGENPGDWFGYSLANAGDFDGDGYDDLAVGGKNCSGACLSFLTADPRYELHKAYLELKTELPGSITWGAGKLYIYYGGPRGLGAKAGQVMEGVQSHALFGFKIVPMGDINHDGFADLAVSSPGWMGRRGRVDIVSGGKRSVPSKYLWTLKGAREMEEFGYMLNSAGDLNGDSKTDLIIGSKKNTQLDIFLSSPNVFEQRPNWSLASADFGCKWGLLSGAAGDAAVHKPGKIFALVYSATSYETPTIGFPGQQGGIMVLGIPK
jgi:hypothetical protein